MIADFADRICNKIKRLVRTLSLQGTIATLGQRDANIAKTQSAPVGERQEQHMGAFFFVGYRKFCSHRPAWLKTLAFLRFI